MSWFKEVVGDQPVTDNFIDGMLKWKPELVKVARELLEHDVVLGYSVAGGRVLVNGGGSQSGAAAFGFHVADVKKAQGWLFKNH
jgi:hypothetical protein